MRKVLVLSCLLFLFNICTVVSETGKLHFQILSDSTSNHEAEIKQEMMLRYDALTEGVDQSSRGVMIRQSLDYFNTDTIEASFDNQTLILIEGDGQGSKIEGSFDQVQCGQPIKNRSWIVELFSK